MKGSPCLGGESVFILMFAGFSVLVAYSFQTWSVEVELWIAVCTVVADLADDARALSVCWASE